MQEFHRDKIQSYSAFIEDSVCWLRDESKKAGTKGLVFGLSGGVDSAVLAALAVRAFGNKARGLIMPIESPDQDEEDANLIADNLGLRVEKFDLNELYIGFLKLNQDRGDSLSKSNIKPRLRMTQLYYYGQREQMLVGGATNLSEYITGYFTKWGDSGVDLLPLIYLTKGEIFELARHLDLPQRIIDREPSAGLMENQTDEMEFGFSYVDLDHYILTGQGPSKVVDKVKRMYQNNDHKRTFAKAFNWKER